MANRIKSITFIRELGVDEKVAPQVKVIVANAIAAHGLNVAITLEQVSTAAEAGLVTRQPVLRVVTYYVDKLVAEGIATVERVVIEKKVAKTDEEKAAAKAAKAAAKPAKKTKGAAAAGEDLSDELGDEAPTDDESETNLDGLNDEAAA